MGITLWLLCGIAAFAVARLISAARPDRITTELTIALAGSLIAGFIATALDFGGWGELDWRAGVFVTICALAAIGLGRLAALLSRSATTR